MNNTEFRRQLVTLAELTNKDLTPTVAKWWGERYSNLPDAVLRRAFEIAAERCRFFPTPAEFNAILEGLAAQSGHIVDGATAWDALDRDVLRTYAPGITKQIPWPDERSREVLRGEMGKLIHDVCQMHPRDLAMVREEFIRRYDAGRMADRAQDTLDRLTASHPAALPARDLRLVSGEE